MVEIEVWAKERAKEHPADGYAKSSKGPESESPHHGFLLEILQARI